MWPIRDGLSSVWEDLRMCECRNRQTGKWVPSRASENFSGMVTSQVAPCFSARFCKEFYRKPAHISLTSRDFDSKRLCRWDSTRRKWKILENFCYACGKISEEFGRWLITRRMISGSCISQDSPSPSMERAWQREWAVSRGEVVRCWNSQSGEFQSRRRRQLRWNEAAAGGHGQSAELCNFSSRLRSNHQSHDGRYLQHYVLYLDSTLHLGNTS